MPVRSNGFYIQTASIYNKIIIMKLIHKYQLAVGFLSILISLANVVLAQNLNTNFVNKDSKLVGFDQAEWFKENIPFVELPDQQIEEVYYYRFSSLKRHLRYNAPGAGYSITEFIQKVYWSHKYDTINAAAGHHIYEARWLRNTRYVQDYINFWSRDTGSGGEAQQYSEWIADSAYASYLVNGDKSFISSQQEGLVHNFNGWIGRFDPILNLYAVTPMEDAMEYSASSLPTDDPFGGGLGFRPSFNSEMYANAIAISKIARLNNDVETAEDFEKRAEAIRIAILKHLWDDERQFFYHMQSENNPNNELLDSREEIGFYPWRWNVPDSSDPKYAAAWEQLFNAQGFDSRYGPTTCEQRSVYFDGNQTNQCCWWNGNSWPYSTSITLRSMANLIRSYPPIPLATAETHLALLHRYAETLYKDDKPYVGECHSPYVKAWICDTFNHSEHYAHSTFTDNVLSDLLGIIPMESDTFSINPTLIPSDWKYFIVENLLYHGHNITVLFDADGTRYNVGSGVKVFLNGELFASSAFLVPLSLPIPPPVINSTRNKNKIENYAANERGSGYPSIEASFTSVTADPYQVIDGRIFYDTVPSNRWTNFDSSNDVDWISVDFGPGRVKEISQIILYIYADADRGGDVDCPVEILVEVMENGNSNWTSVNNPIWIPSACRKNDALTINFNAVRTQKVRVSFSRDVAAGSYIGITEIEIWAPWPQSPEGVYEAEDAYLGIDAEISSSETASGGSYVGHMDNENSFVDFAGVWVDAAGNYLIQIHYANALARISTQLLSVNNLNNQIVEFPFTSLDWGYFHPENYVTVNVTLQRGNNALIFKHLEGFAEIDKITLLSN